MTEPSDEQRLPAAGDDDPQAYELFRRGCRFLEQRHPGQAVLLLSKAVALEPEKTSIREALGRAQYALGRFEDAAETFAEVTVRAPANDYAHFGSARSLLAAGRAAEAVAQGRLAVAMRPGNPEYESALAACLDALERGR